MPYLIFRLPLVFLKNCAVGLRIAYASAVAWLAEARGHQRVLGGIQPSAAPPSPREVYFSALVECAKTELRGTGQKANLEALKAAHRKLYPPLAARASVGLDLYSREGQLERNRRTNYARAAYARTGRWLRQDPARSLIALGAWSYPEVKVQR